jgi:N-acetylmuramoyl-L-alanine amidase
MRKALERHWVEISAVDSDGKAVPGVALEIELADGSVRPAVTDADGFARLEPVPPGNVVIRLPKIDGSGWRAAGAQSSGKKGPARVHAVKQGDCLSSIALKYGFPDWELVWNHDKNADLRKKRKSPHVLRPGDKVAIPGLDIFQISRSTDATHQVEIGTEPKVALDVVLEEFATEPLANRACVLRYDGAKGPEVIDGLNVDDKGRLQVDLPAYVRTVEIEVEGLDEILVLNLGGLDPHSDHDDASALVISGIEQRLHALAYAGTPRGVLDDALRSVLAAYQRRELGRSEAEATGEPDEETCSELEKAYGS